MNNHPLLSVKNLNMTFGHVSALKNITFQLNRGTVTCVLGKNGAGKSCLAKIIGGFLIPDSGEIHMSKIHLTQHTPQESRTNEIFMIPQDMNAFNELDVAENIFIGIHEYDHGIKAALGIINWSKIYADTQEIIKAYGFDINPRQKFGTLSMGEKQIVMILKAISHHARLIIMDEATSALSADDLTNVYALIRRCRSNGYAFLYITHTPNEIDQIADKVLILTDGQLVLDGSATDLRETDLIDKMVGQEISKGYPRLDTGRTYELLRVKDFNRSGIINNVSFRLYGGEILGLTGLLGAGRTMIAKSICGIEPLDRGSVYVRGLKVPKLNPRIARKLGIAYFPENRSDGLYHDQSIVNNISIANLPTAESLFGIVSRKYECYMAQYYVEKLAIQCPNIFSSVKFLSGGNQQKVMFSKWIFANSDILILDEPTKGMDIASKVEIYNIMNEFKRLGKGMLFISSDISELTGMCDRLLVLCDGSIVNEYSCRDLIKGDILYQGSSY